MTQNQDIPVWVEDARALHNVICQARAATDAQAAADFLRHQLQLHRQKLLSLLDDPPKNMSHRSSLQSGQAYVNRTSHRVSNAFSKEALFISDQLDINEHVAASLLMRRSGDASQVSSSAVDAAILSYYSEQGYILACLDAILKTAKDASVSDEVRSVAYEFMADIVYEKVPVNSYGKDSPTVSFPAKLLQTIERIDGISKSIHHSESTTTSQPLTSATNETGSGKLGEEIMAARVERLIDERLYLRQILYHLSSLFWFESDDILQILTMLEHCDLTDTATAYLLLVLVAALSPSSHPDDAMGGVDGIVNDEVFQKKFQEKITNNLWKVPVLKSLIVIRWVDFLLHVAERKPSIMQSLSLSDDVIEKLVEGAISTKVFAFMDEYLLYFKQHLAIIETDRSVLKVNACDPKSKTADGWEVDASDFTRFNATIRSDFQPFVVHELEDVCDAFIHRMSNVLREIKYREEDTSLPAQMPLTTSSAVTSTNDKTTQCHDLEDFLNLLASIYRNRPDAGRKFWSRDDHGLLSFTKWLTDIKVAKTVAASYEFFASISAGLNCADESLRFFHGATDRMDLQKSGLYSWGKLFAALKFYGPLLVKATDDKPMLLPPDEEQLLISFLRLFKQVVLYSAQARGAFLEDVHLDVLGTITMMLSRATSTSLRAALYDVLTAFCSPYAGGSNGVGKRISDSIWYILDTSDFLLPRKHLLQFQTVESNQITDRIVYQSPGILQELEIERSFGIYTETLAVVNLLGSAIHKQSKQEKLISGFLPYDNTIYTHLGKDSGVPGASQYIAMVIDHIFLMVNNQPYRYPGSKWQLTEACLRVLENSVASLDLQRLEALAVKRKETSKKSKILNLQEKNTEPTIYDAFEQHLFEYVTHPGFEVMIRILSGSRVTAEIFKIIESAATVLTSKSEANVYYKQSLLRSLRLLYRVMSIQNVFCNLLLPYVTGLSSRMSSPEFSLCGRSIPAIPSLVSLGQLMLYHTKIIVQISLLMNCEDQEEICLLSTKIIHMLSSEPRSGEQIKQSSLVGTYAPMGGLGLKLAGALGANKDAFSIIHGVSERLEIDQPEVTTYDDYDYDMNNIPFWQAEETLANRYNLDDDFMPRTGCSVRFAIVNMLLDNALADKSSPTITEFLLGYDVMGPPSNLRDPLNNPAALQCLHTILQLLRQGIHDSREADEDRMLEDDKTNDDLLLIVTHPILAEKCYQLIYRLCARESSSAVIMRYLRNREDFFYRQFKAMAARVETAAAVASPVFKGEIISADGSRVTSDFFALRSQLHQRAWLLKSVALELHMTACMRQKSDVIRLLELLYGRDERMQRFNSDTDMETDHPRVYSFSPGSFQQPLMKMFEIVSSLEFVWLDQLAETAGAMIPTYFKDFRADKFTSRSEYGCELYDIRSIYQHLRSEQSREEAEGKVKSDEEKQKLEAEMGSILQNLMAENHRREIAHAKLHNLRAWKEVVQVTLAECFDMFPFEMREHIIYGLLSMLLPKMRLTVGVDTDVLKGLSEVILTLVKRLLEDMRGLKHGHAGHATEADHMILRWPDEKLQFIFEGMVDCIRSDGTTVAIRGDMYTALVSFLQCIRETSTSSSSALQLYLVESVSSKHIKLLELLCRDASDGLDIWKTTAYTTLNSLYVLASSVKNGAVLSFLLKENFLRYTIDMLRREDLALRDVLEQVDAPLVPLYIYEAKMSLFLRLALCKEGAQTLIDNRILDVLSHCQFIIMPPDHNFTLQERYEQLLQPALKLVIALMCSMGHAEVLTAKKQRNALFTSEDTQTRTPLSTSAVICKAEKLIACIRKNLNANGGFGSL
ncbi:nucleoporin Nup186/Nup192/Nup205 [Radiomyces spectabilis]|uniref:nucleoporin Nup186/Nup192/Nup205 n=1 Tax=Radiomyces spectabilis TaxID=64574 RepID=UPI00221E87D1|nr:nucleoporin Nup186/Nup192/Nup205 [Radiomyces spectabilis]KAI8379152.1 nucleoporin Nup186/Nup192/Nup205 [Radiomyces spectabilis]